MQSGEYVDNNAPYGFRLVDKALVVYEPEAAIVPHDVRKLPERPVYIIGDRPGSQQPASKPKPENPPGAPPRWWHTSLEMSGTVAIANTRNLPRHHSPFLNSSEIEVREDMFCASMTHALPIDRDTFDKVQLLPEKATGCLFGKSTTQKYLPSYEPHSRSECGSYFLRRQVSGTRKWGCSKHIQDQNCSSNYLQREERIYDAFIAMVNKLRFSEYDILGQASAPSGIRRAEAKAEKHGRKGESAGTLQI